MSDQNINNITDPNNEFDPENYYMDTVTDGKFDEDIYTSLDLHVDSVPNSQNSSNDDEFDLEQIKQEALTNVGNTPSLESTEPINNFPEIDLLVTSEHKEVYENDGPSNDVIENKANAIYSSKTDLRKGTIKSDTVADISILQGSIELLHSSKQNQDMELNKSTAKCNNTDIEFNKKVYSNIQTNINVKESNIIEEQIYHNKKNFEGLICNWEVGSIPSPFLTSFTPPPSPISAISMHFKKEKSVEISDEYFEGDYFEDDDFNNFQQEEVYTDEFNSIYEDENRDEIEIKEDSSTQNLNEKNRPQENVEDAIMNDHNYFNQEQTIISVESYIKHTNILNNSLNIFIHNLKNCHKIPELLEKQNDIEENVKEIFNKVDFLRKSFIPVLSKSIDNLDVQNQNLEIEEHKIKNEFDKNEQKYTGDAMDQLDCAIMEALKKVENVDEKDESNVLSENLQNDKNNESIDEICSLNAENLIENSKNDVDYEIIKSCTDSEIEDQLISNIVKKKEEEYAMENEVNLSISKVMDEKTEEIPLYTENINDISDLKHDKKSNYENFCESKPWTKYKALVELAKTIVKFLEDIRTDIEIENFFEKSKQEFSQIMLYPNLSNVGIQTEHSGKIYSERRLKSINEKEKRRLLNDSSDSSDVSYEYETDNEDSIKNDSQSENNLNKEEQENILNGIDFSKYLDSSNDGSDNFPNNLSEHLDVILEEEDDVLQVINEENSEKHPELKQGLTREENKKETISGLKKCLTDQKLNGVDKTSDAKEKANFSSNAVDKDIERLLDFKGLTNKRINLPYENVNSDKKSVSKKVVAPDISEILREDDNRDSSDGTETEEEDCIANENIFLSRQNENLKKQLLESSCSSDFEHDSDVILPDDIDDENEEFDENKPTLVEKFLKTYVENESESEEQNEKKINEKHPSELDEILEKTGNDDDAEKTSNEKKKIDNDLENKENDVPDDDSDKQNISSDCEILDKTFASLKQPNKKRKSLDTLLVEDQRRRKNLKISEEVFSLSSEDDESDLEERKTIKTEPHRTTRPIMKTEQLTSETKKAQKEEQARLNRLKKKENILKKAYKEHNKDPSDIRELILDYNTKSKKFITVHNGLVSHLKQHQIDGVKFMYDCCYGSVNFIDDFPGSGCILAHCMGLGKTLQLIALIHTLITHKDLKTARLLILCPKSTVMNWAEEIQRWLGPLGVKNMKVFTFNDTSDIPDKMNVLQEWYSCGSSGSYSSGCLLIGYEAFRTLVSYPNKKNRNMKLDLDEIKLVIKKTLLDPGADLVVCDEGHIIKNRRAAISQAVTEIRTSRRIVLTGTPIQNNLKEYYSMVNFIKPSYLGTEKEFANVYANPIKNGQHKDSSKRDIKIMKQRSFVLHSKLSSFVQRKEAALLKTFLPQKFEYVLFIPMSPVQVKLYEIFLDAVGKREDSEKKGRNLLTDYTCLRKIWTHPKVLENAYNNAIILKNKKEKRMNNNIELGSDEDQPDDIYDSQTGLMSVTSDWWRQHLADQDLKSILPSNKLQTMFEILRMCTENREKCLIFSAFVAVLNVVEYFMNLINEKNSETAKELGIDRFKGPWVNGKDYYRLDGKTQKTLRHEMVKRFNDPTNERARVFLISAKAGGQGINLIGANRVIILDTSWNPSNDQQNIFRIFRLGQKRNCYIYRLISFGTMEEKVYSRSVTKQAMSFRVVDEHQIDRHYSMAELAELYALTKPDYSNRPIPNLPQDNILAHLLRNFQYVFKYHEHDSLLENKIEQELSEQEKEDAWLAYESEINSVANGAFPNFPGLDIFGNQQMGIPILDNFSRSPSSNDIFNQGRVPVTSPQFFPGYNYPNKNYLDNVFSYFSNTNPLYGGIDLTKSPVYGDSLNSNFLLPNNRPPGAALGLPNPPPTSSPNYPSLDSLHIPSSHPSTYNQNLTPYNALYSSANNLLNSSLNRYNNTSLENFKRVFENYVNAPPNMANIGNYSSNQNKNQSNSDIRNKAADIGNSSSKSELNSFRKHNVHPNFSASLATSSSGSMTNSILNAQNRLINQSSTADLSVPSKRNNSPGLTMTNVQKESKNQQGANQYSSNPLAGNSPASNTFVHTHSSNASNNQTRSSNKINHSDAKKTDTLRNAALGALKSDSPILNRTSSPKTITNESDDRSGNKLKQISTQKTNLAKNLSNQNLLAQSFATKNTTSHQSTSKVQSLVLGQNSSLSNNNLSQPSSKVMLKKPTNLTKNNSPTQQSISNQMSLGQVNLSTSRGKTNSPTTVNLNTLRVKTNSPTTVDATIRKHIDLPNISKNKSTNLPLSISSKNNSILKKSLPLQFNQDGQKGQNTYSSNTSATPKVNKILIDPLSTAVEDKLLNAGISISKKPVNPKAVISISNSNAKQSNQTISNQLQNAMLQRKRFLNQETNSKGESSVSNRVDPISKRPKLTPKELAEELSSSLKRIQSSKTVTISHKGAAKGTSLSSDVLEVD